VRSPAENSARHQRASKPPDVAKSCCFTPSPRSPHPEPKPRARVEVLEIIRRAERNSVFEVIPNRASVSGKSKAALSLFAGFGEKPFSKKKNPLGTTMLESVMAGPIRGDRRLRAGGSRLILSVKRGGFNGNTEKHQARNDQPVRKPIGLAAIRCSLHPALGGF